MKKILLKFYQKFSLGNELNSKRVGILETYFELIPLIVIPPVIWKDLPRREDGVMSMQGADKINKPRNAVVGLTERLNS